MIMLVDIKIVHILVLNNINKLLYSWRILNIFHFKICINAYSFLHFKKMYIFWIFMPAFGVFNSIFEETCLEEIKTINFKHS